MKAMARVMLAVAVGLVFTVSATFAGDPPVTGFLGAESVYKQLTPGPDGGAKLRWLKPGTNFKKYEKFMVDSVVFYLAPDAEKAIEPQEMKEMADAFNLELVKAFKDKYPIVAEPGPNVARLVIAITNVKPSKPGVSAVTSIVPVGLAVSLVTKGATGGWTGSGETGAELMAVDSTTKETIALAVDQQQAAFSERFSKLGSAKEAFKFWSERIVAFLDDANGIKRQPK